MNIISNLFLKFHIYKKIFASDPVRSLVIIYNSFCNSWFSIEIIPFPLCGNLDLFFPLAVVVDS